MKLRDLAAEPQLIEITLDDTDTVERYGEPVVFYTWDRQSIDTFVKLAAVGENNVGEMMSTVKTLILDESAQPIIQGSTTLPTGLLLKAITAVVERVGK